MKMDLDEIRQVVREVVSEAKKKKEKADALKKEPHPSAYAYADALDFSAPLGAYNLYKSQGAVNWGPETGVGTKIDDAATGAKHDKESSDESLLRSFVNDVVKECVEKESAWAGFDESVERNVWESVIVMYEKKANTASKKGADAPVDKKKDKK